MTTPKIPEKFKDPRGGLAFFEEQAQNLNDKLNPFAAAQDRIGEIPFYQTGARAFIKIGGKPIGVAQEVRWQVAYTGTPIFTIDTPHAWDIDVGQASVSASLSQIMDPTKGPEADGLFHTMQSAVHQPFVELQILDKLGTSLFFSRGMFLSVSGSVARGQMSTFNANFTGVLYQHYVAQFFKPYDSLAGAATGLVNGLKNLASDFTGGII